MKSEKTLIVSGNKKIRCLLVHDHVLLRQGLRRLLQDEADIEVVAEAGTPVEALRAAFEQRPEVVIADASTFGSPADQVERLILRESPYSRVLLLTMRDDEPVNTRGDSASCAVRETSAQELIDAVRRIHSARGFVREMPRRGRPEWMVDDSHSRKRALTSREREVLKLLAEGRTVRSVAVILGLSMKTVDAHKFNLMRKLGVHNKAELVMWAIQKKVVKLPANY